VQWSWNIHKLHLLKACAKCHVLSYVDWYTVTRVVTKRSGTLRWKDNLSWISHLSWKSLLRKVRRRCLSWNCRLEYSETSLMDYSKSVLIIQTTWRQSIFAFFVWQNWTVDWNLVRMEGVVCKLIQKFGAPMLLSKWSDREALYTPWVVVASCYCEACPVLSDVPVALLFIEFIRA